jgi:hypothetical protein
MCGGSRGNLQVHYRYRKSAATATLDCRNTAAWHTRWRSSAAARYRLGGRYGNTPAAKAIPAAKTAQTLTSRPFRPLRARCRNDPRLAAAPSRLTRQRQPAGEP